MTSKDWFRPTSSFFTLGSANVSAPSHAFMDGTRLSRLRCGREMAEQLDYPRRLMGNRRTYMRVPRVEDSQVAEMIHVVNRMFRETHISIHRRGLATVQCSAQHPIISSSATLVTPRQPSRRDSGTMLQYTAIYMDQRACTELDKRMKE